MLSYAKFEIQLNRKKSEFLLSVLDTYGCFIESSLNVCLDDARTKNDVNNNESDELADENEVDSKKVLKSFEESIECKILALEIIKSIAGYFSKGTFIFQN